MVIRHHVVTSRVQIPVAGHNATITGRVVVSVSSCIQENIAKAENGKSRQDQPQHCPDAQILVRNQVFSPSRLCQRLFVRVKALSTIKNNIDIKLIAGQNRATRNEPCEGCSRLISLPDGLPAMPWLQGQVSPGTRCSGREERHCSSPFCRKTGIAQGHFPRNKSALC